MAKLTICRIAVTIILFFGIAGSESAQAQSEQDKVQLMLEQSKIRLDNEHLLLKATIDQQQETTDLIAEQQVKLEQLLVSQVELEQRGFEKHSSYDSLPEILRQLEVSRAQLLISLAGRKARRAAILEFAATDEKLEKNDDKVHADPRTAMEDLVNIEKMKLERAEKLRADGLVSGEGILLARKDLINAQVRLAEWDIKNTQVRVEGQFSEKKKEQLLDVSLDIAEMQAQLNSTEQLLDQLASARAFVVEIENIKRSLPLETRRLEKLRDQLVEVEQNSNAHQARVRAMQQEIMVLQELHAKLQKGNKENQDK